MQLIRHATMTISINGQQLLLDPMLSPPGSMAAVPGVRNTRASLIVVHMEAWNHCGLSWQELKVYLQENNLDDRVQVPADGDKLIF